MKLTLLFALVLPLLHSAFANANESAAEKSMDDLAVICIEAKIGPFSYESVSISNAFEAIIKAANQECSKKGYGIRLNYILSGSEEWEKRERKLQIGCVPILEACEKAGKVFRADVFYSQGSIAVSEKKITDEQLVAFDRDFQNVLKSLFVESISFKGGSSVDLIRKVCQESNKLLEKEGHGTIGLMLQVNDDDRISPMVIPSNTIYDAFNFAANRIGAKLEYVLGNFRITQTNAFEESANSLCNADVGDLGAAWPYRCVLRAPKGVDRLGFGYFNGISFGEGYIKQDGDLLKTNEEGSAFVVDRLLQEKYLRFRRIKLFYSKARQRLYKLVLERDINGEETARETNGDVERMVKEFSWNYATAFTKITSDGKDLTGEDQLKRVYSYQNSDVDYPIEISVLKRNDSKALKVSIQSNAVLRKLEGAERKKKTATESLPSESVQVEVDI